MEIRLYFKNGLELKYGAMEEDMSDFIKELEQKEGATADLVLDGVGEKWVSVRKSEVIAWIVNENS